MVFCFVVLIIHRMNVISNAFMHAMMCLMCRLLWVFLSHSNVYFVCEKKTTVNAYVFTLLTAVQRNPLHIPISQLNSHIVIEWIFFFVIFKKLSFEIRLFSFWIIHIIYQYFTYLLLRKCWICHRYSIHASVMIQVQYFNNTFLWSKLIVSNVMLIFIK